jgi:hypothetical protein
MELVMKHSGKRIEWNSYGGVGESLEIRSGREIYTGNDQTKERERFYRGEIMNTFKLIENLYHISIHDSLSPENRQKLIWIQEFLAMFDFLWNHGDLFMEVINIPISPEGKFSGSYNTVYAQFLKRSFEKQKKIKDIFSIVHGENIENILKKRNHKDTHAVTLSTFHEHNKSPIGDVCWQYALYPYEAISEYKTMFSLGFLVHKIHKHNVFVRIFRYFFKKHQADI